MIEDGILPNGSQITSETKKRLLGYVSTAYAAARTDGSIGYDHSLTMLRLINALGEAGFYGEESRLR